MGRISTERFFLAMGATLGFTGVAAGAFAAHILQSHLPTDMLGIFEVAVRYQMYHALALLVLSLLVSHSPVPSITWAGGFMSTGIVIFSGTLYALSLSGQSWWGAITPIGGLALLAGWACLIWTAYSIKA